MKIISPSIICADFLHIKNELNELEEAGIQQIHIDVMDGIFVPQITIGQLFTTQCRKQTKMKLDIHLMVVSPEKQIESFVKAGADNITFHYEATDKPIDILQQIRKNDIKCGISLQPDTNIEVLNDIFSKFIPDKILIMSVFAGKSGQSFIESSIAKVKNIDETLQRLKIRDKVKIQIDGGINLDTAIKVRNYVDEFVVGSALFSKKGLQRKKFITNLNKVIA